MYKVAIIQNDSEMMRYSWADIRPMINSLGYSYDAYTANDLNILYTKLDHYDALVIATNACNDEKIRESLDSHENEILSFLEKGRGLTALFQMKKDEREFFNFLPSEFRVKTVKRNEDIKSGNLHFNESANNHPLISYPNKIDINQIKNHCLNNNHVKGLYWTYLEPNNIELYNIIIEDISNEKENRPLMLLSREDFNFRILISAIALDWQIHDDLWANSIKYIVEGRTHVALITNDTSNDYDYKYLTSWLKVNKIPVKLYQNNDIDLSSIQFKIHSVYILDPNISANQLKRFVEYSSSYVDAGVAEVIFFDTNKFSKPFIGTISNTRQFQTIAKNSIIWIKNQFPDAHGYFARSFWNTVDVLNTLSVFKESTQQFKTEILNEIAKHDRGGCYDEVLGATCAMYEVYHFYLGESNEKTISTLKWILENYHDKILFERASAIEVLVRFNYALKESEIISFKNEIVNFFQTSNPPIKNNEFRIFRFCETLFICGFIKEAMEISLKLKLTQEEDGKWVNISHTAAITELLMRIQENVDDPDPNIEEMIFKGIEFLYDNYSYHDSSWNKDVLSTAKSLKTLKLFEDKIQLPVDVIKNRVVEEGKRINNFSAIDLASKLNLKYINHVNLLRDEVAKLKELNNLSNIKKNRFRIFSSVFAPFVIVFMAISVVTIYIITSNTLWPAVGKLVGSYIKDNIATILVFIISFTIWVTILVLNESKLIPENTPRWVKKFIIRIVPETEFDIEENKNKL